MTEKPKAVVLLSGGMDSCVTVAIAHQTHRLALVHASYGQRTERRERRPSGIHRSRCGRQLGLPGLPAGVLPCLFGAGAGGDKAGDPD